MKRLLPYLFGFLLLILSLLMLFSAMGCSLLRGATGTDAASRMSLAPNGQDAFAQRMQAMGFGGAP